MAAPAGRPVYALASGKVLDSRYTMNNDYGKPDDSVMSWAGSANYVKIDHGGVEVQYYHLGMKMFVSPGDIVSKGQQIGVVGSTGASTGFHLHLEAYETTKNRRLVAPTQYFNIDEAMNRKNIPSDADVNNGSASNTNRTDAGKKDLNGKINREYATGSKGNLNAAQRDAMGCVSPSIVGQRNGLEDVAYVSKPIY
jgi:murein DD-endopeptidase MepM/ murein hydrolase activator NlpD